MWDRQTEKQKKAKGTKRAKCYYLVKLAKGCVLGQRQKGNNWGCQE